MKPNVCDIDTIGHVCIRSFNWTLSLGLCGKLSRLDDDHYGLIYDVLPNWECWPIYSEPIEWSIERGRTVIHYKTRHCFWPFFSRHTHTYSPLSLPIVWIRHCHKDTLTLLHVTSCHLFVCTNRQLTKLQFQIDSKP